MSPQRSAQLPDLTQPSFRSGAVARMAGMPVATLRIWEQRYQAVRPITAASGHRLYSTADVDRVILLRRLTEQGHAIGLLAALEIEQMRALMHASKSPGSTEGRDAQARPSAMRIVVVGQALASRLQRSVDRFGGLALEWLGVFDSLADAARAAQALTSPSVDLLLWHSASLQPGARNELRLAQAAWCARAAAVVYRYSNAAARAELAGTGTALFHEPANDESFVEWLASQQPASISTGKAFTSAPNLTSTVAMNVDDQAVSAPRFAEQGLTEFAGLSSTIACECPSHVAELLLQISNFETYSGECANRNAADAALHAYLQRVAGVARMLFETALEHIAVAEGLPLPRAESFAPQRDSAKEPKTH